MDTTNNYILFKDSIQINQSRFNVTVNIIKDDRGQLHYCALINDVKPMELNINGDGVWYDVKLGATDISKAIGDLIEQKCL